jgi:uncharacterized protein YbgA (DUF1722 family)/uncharacterized protein YbbK (DUF523 family)
MKSKSQTATRPSPPIRVGISRCLLGEPVRYDGNHKHDPFLTGTLGQYVEFIPLCPEAEAGLGIPREAMRLVGEPAAPKLITRNSGQDCTAPLLAWIPTALDRLEREQITGFIFKSKSPSCGVERIKIYGDHGQPVASGSGLFAGALMERMPLLPVEEEGRLHDPLLRESFIERLFVSHRWQQLCADTGTVPERGELIHFHTRHKLLIMAHSVRHYREMGRLLAGDGEKDSPADLVARYTEALQQALSLRATVKKHVNVLQHIQGYFKRQLDSDEKQELCEWIENYSKGLVPLIVPVTLLNHYVRKYGQPYLAEQWYLNPHPLELRLRNHV